MFKSIPAEDVLSIWPQVSPGIQAIRRKCNATWTAEHIRGRLLEARATLFVHEHGFIVMERCYDTFTGEPYLNAWLMWFKPGEAMKIREQLVAWLNEMKRFHKCAWWQFASPREEWGATIAPYCDKSMITWRSRDE